MLTIEEIKKELDAGNTIELECVDFNGYKNKCDKYDADYIDTNNIFVFAFENISETIIRTNNGVIYLDSIKYFRIKRPVPAFDDLIDVAVKALKDGVLGKRIMTLSDYQIGVNIDSRDYLWSGKNVVEGIEFFKSLYTETFTIESESDIKRIKQEAKIALCNGEIIVAKKRTFSQFCIIYHKDKHHPCEKLWIESLKGATVTQSRGEI